MAKVFEIKKLQDGYYKVRDSKFEFSSSQNKYGVHTILGVLYATLNKNSVISFNGCTPKDFDNTESQVVLLADKFKVYIDGERIFPYEVHKLY